jgi:hypothetical protein
MGSSLFDPTIVARAALLGLSLSGLLVERLRWHALLATLSGVLIIGSLVLLRRAVA